MRSEPSARTDRGDTAKPAGRRLHGAGQREAGLGGGEDFFLSASTDGQTTDRHFASLAGRSATISGPLAGTRNAIRTWVTISALVAGVAMLLMTLRGIVRRLRSRPLAARGERLPAKFLVPFLLYLCVVGGLIALGASAGLNYLWETPLITLPKI